MTVPPVPTAQPCPDSSNAIARRSSPAAADAADAWTVHVRALASKRNTVALLPTAHAVVAPANATPWRSCAVGVVDVSQLPSSNHVSAVPRPPTATASDGVPGATAMASSGCCAGCAHRRMPLSDRWRVQYPRWLEFGGDTSTPRRVTTQPSSADANDPEMAPSLAVGSCDQTRLAEWYRTSPLGVTAITEPPVTPSIVAIGPMPSGSRSSHTSISCAPP